MCLVQDLSLQVEAIRHGQDKSHETATHRTVLHELLESKLPPHELNRDRLRDEAFSLMTAGSGTTYDSLTSFPFSLRHTVLPHYSLSLFVEYLSDLLI